METYDSYTQGNYEHSVKESAEKLANYPESYELYYIYIRSLDHMGKPFEQIFPKDSWAASILENMNSIVRGESNWRASSDAILKYSMVLGRDQLAYGLYDIYLHETMPVQNEHFHKLALLNASPNNPRFAMIYDNSDKAEAYLDQFSTATQSSTVALFRQIATSKHKLDSNFVDSIPDARKRIYSAQVCESNGSYREAIMLLEPLVADIMNDKIKEGFYTLDRLTKSLFRCYLENQNYGECADLVVSSFMKNQLLIRKLPILQLIKAIDQVLSPEVQRKISYPILFALFYTKPHPIYVAYDNYINGIGIRRPSELFTIADQFSKRELIEFLFKVCTIDVLAYSYHITGTKDLESERIRICQYLSEEDPANLKRYAEEISRITSRSLRREGMRQIDVSKIYVDETGIRTSGRKILEEGFERYRDLTALGSIDGMRMLNLETFQWLTVSDDGEIVKRAMTNAELERAVPEIKYINNPLYLNLRELFMDIRDRFISSGDYGLDGYLSVRIRHGVLQNQIRSTFESSHLMSEKDTSTGEYLPNPYWETRLEELSSEDRTSIHKLLANFSQSVDDLNDKLNKEYIQVRTEKKNQAGLFDYIFSSDEMFKIFDDLKSIADYEQFINEAFGVLWKRTQENLDRIYKFMSIELKNAIYLGISQLDRDIRDSVLPGQAAELLQNVAKCQTALQYSLQSVAEWFTISGSSPVQQFTLEDLASICIESINNIYPTKKVRPEVKCNDNVVIDGRFFTPLYDIMRTLMDNVIVHSGMPHEKMNIEIEINIKDESMSMEIKNCLDKEVRKLDPVNSMRDILSSAEVASNTGVIAKEGRSGLMKIRKIMVIDLQRKHPHINFRYDEHDRFVVQIRMELEGLRK